MFTFTSIVPVVVLSGSSKYPGLDLVSAPEVICSTWSCAVRELHKVLGQSFLNRLALQWMVHFEASDGNSPTAQYRYCMLFAVVFDLCQVAYSQVKQFIIADPSQINANRHDFGIVIVGSLSKNQRLPSPVMHFCYCLPKATSNHLRI